jgi:hypothetical protein
MLIAESKMQGVFADQNTMLTYKRMMMMKQLAQAQCKKISGGTVIPPDKPIPANQN